MELSTLAAKQKRVKDWKEFCEQVQIEELKTQILNTLHLYQQTLTKCWEAEKIEEGDQKQLTDLERQLEDLNEQARLRVRGKKTKSCCGCT